jgi:hypothetical protein
MQASQQDPMDGAYCRLPEYQAQADKGAGGRERQRMEFMMIRRRWNGGGAALLQPCIISAAAHGGRPTHFCLLPWCSVAAPSLSLSLRAELVIEAASSASTVVATGILKAAATMQFYCRRRRFGRPWIRTGDMHAS